MPITSASSLRNISLQQFSANTPVSEGRSNALFIKALVSVTNSPVILNAYQTPSDGTQVDCPRIANYPDSSMARYVWEVEVSNSAPRIVTKKILSELLMADKAIRLTQVALPFGSTNQVADVWRTNAENILRRRIRLLAEDGQSLKAIVTSGVGNCSEHSKVTAALLLSEPTKSPLFRVAAEGMDHNFVLIGDQREIDSSEVVVADSWVKFPIAHTLDEGKFSPGNVLEQFAPTSKPDPRFTIDQSCFTKLPADSGGDKKAKEYLTEKRESGGVMYQYWTSSASVGRNVRTEGSPKTYSFDRFPRQQIDEMTETFNAYYEWYPKEEDDSE
ncbi:hypothetical protein QN416_01990 [Glaciimonas sp. Cout2]|uniref:hypothetical protein n=1 Tax=Glaciimonas sp. Cout2 TaxID=3048621 RepID=UPI002B237151|nr:hypothetical protein [Glaciimonas sp. Cout2]MEB0010382.1 hypothetical protein [Glaciimonas sp. Cout2]